MVASVEFHGRRVAVHCSRAAEKALMGRSTPLRVEMELLFSCLLRKAVRFGERARGEAFVAASPALEISFRPVQTRTCPVKDSPHAAPIDDFPIVRPEPFVPRWLRIDYRGGNWVGEFGYLPA
jgi:hypothetical protein